MFDWLGISAINPLLLWGSLAVASPIIIHLLAKRRYRIVDWAAMSFLLEADRRNRRRIRLEHLLLLLLRCLAILLIAFLVSRLFLQPSGLAALAMQPTRTDRIVLLDDSPSMGLRSGGQSVFDQAKQSLTQFVRSTSLQRPGDTLTLVLASQPDRPILNGAYLEKAEEAIKAIDELSLSDQSTDLAGACLAINRMIQADEEAGAINRVVYLVTDQRQRDWQSDEAVAESESNQPNALATSLQALAEATDGVLVIDVGAEAGMNLTVESITSEEKVLAAGVTTRFEVAVVNHGMTSVEDVPVVFSVADAPPAERFIGRIEPGQRAAASFSFTFTEPGSRAVTVELPADSLAADNRRYFAAQVASGLRVLIVDGDPSTRFARNDAFYVNRALQPPGQAFSGNLVEVISDNQFQSADLDQYQVVFLCNVYQVGRTQREALARWVENGGGLVIAPGDQIDGEVYNQQLAGDATPLLPAPLVTVKGDLSQQQWIQLGSADAAHPVTNLFSGSGNPFMQQIKFFRWWVYDNEQFAPDTRVLARFNDDDASAAMLERPYGNGRVLALAGPLDDDWSSWPSDPSYVVTMLEIVRYLSRGLEGTANLPVGSPLTWPADLSQYAVEARLEPAGGGETVTIQATQVEPADGEPDGPATPAPADGAADDEAAEPVIGVSGEADQPVAMAWQYDEVARAGFYELTRQRHEGAVEVVRVAANVDASEGDLTPADLTEIKRQLSEVNVQWVRGDGYLTEGAGGGRSELWRSLLLALIIVLCAEQFLAWSFGRSR